MNALKLAAAVKGTSLCDLVVALEANGPNWENDPSEDRGENFPREKENYLRSLTSGVLKAKYPQRVYSVNRDLVEGEKIIKVRRLK